MSPGGPAAALMLAAALASGCRRAGPRVDPAVDDLASTSASAVTSAGALPAPSASSSAPVSEVWSQEKHLARRYPSPAGDRIAYQDGKGGLWVAAADGSGARRVLDTATARVENPPRAAPLAQSTLFWLMAWSPDAARIHVLADGWGNSRALYSVELATGRVRFLHGAQSLDVIDRCTDAAQLGRLIVLEHTGYGPQHPIGDVYVLLDERGGLHGEVGLAPANVERFLARVCGVGAAPPDPPDEVPARLRARPFTCGKHRVRYEPRRFLDGTEHPLFRWERVGPAVPGDEGPWWLGGLELTRGNVRDMCPEAAAEDVPFRTSP